MFDSHRAAGHEKHAVQKIQAVSGELDVGWIDPLADYQDIRPQVVEYRVIAVTWIINKRVVSYSALEPVVAETALQGVVARQTFYCVIAGCAGEGVIAQCAGDRLALLVVRRELDQVQPFGFLRVGVADAAYQAQAVPAVTGQIARALWRRCRM